MATATLEKKSGKKKSTAKNASDSKKNSTTKQTLKSKTGFTPQAIKISSKRQITIPSKLFKEKGFTDYAWIEETEDGFFIKPIEVEDEDVAIYVLKRLVESGLEGNELIERYEKAYPEVLDFHKRIQQSHQDFLDEKGEDAHVVQARMREKYGL